MIELEPLNEPVYALSYSPDGSCLLGATKSGQVILWDLFGQKQLQQASEYPGSRIVLAWSPDSSTFVFSNHEFFVQQSLNDGQQKRSMLRSLVKIGVDPLSRPQTEITGLVYLKPDLLAVASGRWAGGCPGEVTLWSIPKAVPRPHHLLESHGVRALTAHQSTSQLAWINGNKQCQLWPIEKQNRTTWNLGQTGNGLAFSNDGSLLYVAAEWKIRRLPTNQQRELPSLEGHKGLVTAVAVTADGQRIISTSWDETIRIWDSGSGRETACLRTGTGKVLSLAVSPDGTLAAAGTLNGRILVWDLE